MPRGRKTQPYKSYNPNEYSSQGMRPTASIDNPCFPRKHISMTEESWGHKNSMLPTRYSTARPPGPVIAPVPPVGHPQAFDSHVCAEPLPLLSKGSVGASYHCCEWFQDEEAKRLAREKRLAEKKRHKPLSIPQDDPNKNRYPYRYSSAGPAPSGKTKKEVDLRRCRRLIEPIIQPHRDRNPGANFRWTNVFEPKDYETTSLQASLVPLVHKERKMRQHAILSTNAIPRGSLTAIKLPLKAQTEFDRYVIANIKEKELRDAFTTRKLLFSARESDQRPKWDNIWHLPVPNYIKNKKAYNISSIKIKSKRSTDRDLK